MRDAVLSDDEIRSRLTSHPDWELRAGRLHRELHYEDFAQAFMFMTRVAAEAERLNHHPDWSNSWNTVVIDISSHAAGGITERCFELAEAIDRVA